MSRKQRTSSAHPLSRYASLFPPLLPSRKLCTLPPFVSLIVSFSSWTLNDFLCIFVLWSTYPSKLLDHALVCRISPVSPSPQLESLSSCILSNAVIMFWSFGSSLTLYFFLRYCAFQAMRACRGTSPAHLSARVRSTRYVRTAKCCAPGCRLWEIEKYAISCYIPARLYVALFSYICFYMLCAILL